MKEQLEPSKESVAKIYGLMDNVDKSLDFILEIEIREENGHSKFYVKNINNIYSEYLKMKPNEIIGKDIFDIHHPHSEKIYDEIKDCLYKDKNKKSARFFIKKKKEECLVILDGEILVEDDWKYWQTTVYPIIRTDESMKVFVVVKDITKRLKNMQENEAQKAVKIYDDKIMSISEMISNLSHVWRQPLNSLNFCMLNLMDEIKNEYEDHGNLESYYQEAWEIINNLSKKIDKFQKIFEQKDNIQFFEPKKYMDLTFEIMEEKIKKYHIKINMKTKEKINIYGNPNEFAQLMYYIFYDIIEWYKDYFDIQNKNLSIQMNVNNNKMNILIKIKYNKEKNKNIVLNLNRLKRIKNIIQKKMNGNIELIDDLEKGIVLSFPLDLREGSLWKE